MLKSNKTSVLFCSSYGLTLANSVLVLRIRSVPSDPILTFFKSQPFQPNYFSEMISECQTV